MFSDCFIFIMYLSAEVLFFFVCFTKQSNAAVFALKTSCLQPQYNYPVE